MIKVTHDYSPFAKSVIVCFCILFLAGCDEKKEELHEFKKVRYSEGTVLTFSSDLHREEFIVQKVVNGRYEDSRSGTCSKPPLTIYEYQAVYLKPIDSLDRKFSMISEYSDDCISYPNLAKGKGIASFVGTYSALANDQINWLDEFYGKISDFNAQHASITLQSQSFSNVYEYTVTSNKRLATIYYSHRDGFVGYVLATGEVFARTNP